MRVLGYSGLHGSVDFKKGMFPQLENRRYRFSQGFDSAAALVVDGEIVAAAAEERFTGDKTTGSFPVNAISYCLAEAGIKLDEVDRIAHGFAYAPPSASASDARAAKRFEQVYSARAQLKHFAEFLPTQNWQDRFTSVPHHLAHAASTFFPSGFENALVVVTDGMGESSSLTIATGRNDHLEVVTTIPALHSIGMLYSLVTHYLGFVPAMDEYKVMGLAPYGEAGRYLDVFSDFVRLREDGTYTVPLMARDRTADERETHDGVLRELAERLGPARRPEEPTGRRHADIAAALQVTAETALLHVLRVARSRTGQRRLCLAGGVALNCTANGVVSRSGLFDDIFVQPAAGDDGTAIGAALYVDAAAAAHRGRMTMPYWGPGYDDAELATVAAAADGCTVTELAEEALVDHVAELLVGGFIVAWFQGRMEFGPRALGNRSILADPRDQSMRDRLNAVVKEREGFRPFAPAVASAQASDCFDIEPGTEGRYAHMLFVTQARPQWRDKLGAVTHVDGSARVQTVQQRDNPRFWGVIQAFGCRTGVPVILNTSFNLRGQPVIASPTEALRTFLRSNLDALVLGRTVVHKGAATHAD
ncbi:carbamoyltransferase C-terminal domain-containing protein [Dactylosporangium sp. NPDC050588]|uniref:carbamoyltransferase family protein n=1 Tax=Dactylosporangium sp. NPDC050588 TaxID=3157211 RepID=UPI0033CE9DD9